jgi:hypothetical protein
MTRDQLLDCLSEACCEDQDPQRRASSDQSTLSFAAGKQRKNATAIELAVCKVLAGSSSSSSPIPQRQSSLLALWGGKQNSAPPAVEQQQSDQFVSLKWIAANGFAAVLSHRVCAL